MRRFLDSGYADIDSIINLKMPFTFIIGGRGTGKTYGALKYIIEHKKTMMLMRRTQAQTDLINKPEFSPFKVLETDLKIKIDVKPISKYSAAITRYTDDTPVLVGFTCALSTISNLRGFDASDIEFLIYDEFIPEKHERPIKNEGAAFLNAYETINRNRELKGDPPVRVLALANAFDIANSLFIDLDIVRICEQMKKKNNYTYINQGRGLAIVMLDGSIISDKKSKTALYKLSADESFNQMSLANDFAYNSRENIKSMNLKEFRPVCGIDKVFIYKHKSRDIYYISEHKSGKMVIYENDDANIKRFQTHYGRKLYRQYMKNNVKFENIVVKSVFEWYII